MIRDWQFPATTVCRDVEDFCLPGEHFWGRSESGAGDIEDHIHLIRLVISLVAQQPSFCDLRTWKNLRGLACTIGVKDVAKKVEPILLRCGTAANPESFPESSL